jgi:hypothetical protein
MILSTPPLGGWGVGWGMGSLELRFSILSDFQVTVVLYSYLYGVYEVGSFVFGLDAFGSEFGFVGNPAYGAGVLAAIVFTKVGKYTDGLSLFQLA